MDQNATYIPNTMWRFILFALKPHRTLLLFYILTGIFAMVGHTLMFHYIGKAVDVLASYDGERKDIWPIIQPTLLKIAFYGILLDGILGSRLRNYISIAFNEDILFRLRNQVVEYLSQHSLKYFHNDFTGRISSKASEIANSFASGTNIILKNGVDAVISTMMAIFLFKNVHWIFGLTLFFWAFLFVLIGLMSTKKVHGLSALYSEKRSQMIGHLVDMITNISSVISFSRHKFETEEFRKRSADVKTVILKKKYFVAHLDVVREVLWQILFLPMLLLMIWAWQKNLVTPGDITMVTSLSLVIARYAWNFSVSLVDVYTELGIVEDAIKTLIKPHDITDEISAQHISIKAAPVIQIKDLKFTHDQKNILFRGLNIDIQSEEKIGLVGPSGAGKSTLTSLVLRHYDVEKGSILIGGYDIHDFTQSSLRKNISYIPQDTELFHRSFMENIRYGQPSASDKEVIDAAKKACAHEFIMKTEHEYQTMVGERGVKLSGGQRQRIAIARAILKDAPILILDEATSALDSESEQYIQTHLKTLMKGKTVIAIAHRLSTIASMDRIIVMDTGQIIEQGSHDTLINKKDGLYQRLWKHQSGGFI